MIYESNKDALRAMQEEAGIDVPDNPYTDTIFPGKDLVMPKVTSAVWLANHPDPIEFDPPGVPIEPPFSADRSPVAQA
jgi:hypothetical protein